jgi:2-deoxy-D-gluconate 3-dehydrogenase
VPVPNPFDFSGKTVVLTGATGGLGRHVTLAFGAAGADVHQGDINEPAAARLAEEIRAAGGRATAARLDVCDQTQVRAFMEEVKQRAGKIDVLVNCAGTIVRRPSVDYDLADWQRIVDINLKGTWLCCQEGGRIMIEQGFGRIVNYASNAGLHGLPGYPAYSPAKAGVISLTKVLGVEWAKHGLRVNAVAPGFTETPFNDDVLGDPVKVQAVLARMPVGRVLPADALVEPTLFLASDAARWINGHTLNVDGGFNAT